MTSQSYAITPIWVDAFLVFIATFPLVLRIISRRIGRADFWWDDWFAFAAWPFSVVESTLILAGLALNGIPASFHGFGRHGGDPTFFLQILYFDELWYNTGIALTKFSVLCFYFRIFEAKPGFRRQLWLTSILVLLWWITFMFASIFQCIPIRGYWNPNIKAVCVDKFAFFIGQAVPNIFLDIVLLVLPIRPLWNLNMRQTQRILLLALFILGYLNPIISILRIVSFIQLGHKTGMDINYNFVSPALWSATEIAIAIFSSSIPALTHLYRRIIASYRESRAAISVKLSTWSRSTRETPRRRGKRNDTVNTFDLLRSGDENIDISRSGTEQIIGAQPHESGSSVLDPDSIPVNQIHVQHDINVSSQS